MNTRDSEHMIAELNAHEGYELTDDASAADPRHGSMPARHAPARPESQTI